MIFNNIENLPKDHSSQISYDVFFIFFEKQPLMDLRKSYILNISNNLLMNSYFLAMAIPSKHPRDWGVSGRAGALTPRRFDAVRKSASWAVPAAWVPGTRARSGDGHLLVESLGFLGLSLFFLLLLWA